MENQEWISVKDRLPPEGEEVLTWARFPMHGRPMMQMQVLRYFKATGDRWWYGHWQNSSLEDGYVTHWRPRPLGPEGEDDAA